MKTQSLLLNAILLQKIVKGVQFGTLQHVLAIHLIPDDTRHLCTRFFFSINDVSETWSFRRQTKLMFKFAKYEKSLPSLFIPSNKTIRQF